MGRTRGDFLGGIFYGSNWYQIFVGQGYTASEAFVPLRHLWSLAVEEQFYLIWPLVMVLRPARSAARDLPRIGAVAGRHQRRRSLWWSRCCSTAATSPRRAPPISARATGTLFGRCISINEALYLGTFSRAGGLLLGAAFAMVWRPMALLRGGCANKARQLDVRRRRRPRRCSAG